MTAEEFNNRYSVGTSVNYHSIIGDPAHVKTVTRSEAWELGSGHVVVQVKGKSGGVSVEAITIDPEVEMYINLGLIVETHNLGCLCDDCKEFLKQGDVIHAQGLQA